MRVAISDLLNENEAGHQLKAMQQNSSNIWYQQVDITNESAVANWIDAVEIKWGVPQIIVANAGIVVAGSLTNNNFSADKMHQQFDVNFWGSYHLAVLSAKKLKENNLPGRITFIGSWAAERPNARISSLASSSAKVLHNIRTAAFEIQ